MTKTILIGAGGYATEVQENICFHNKVKLLEGPFFDRSHARQQRL
jgi:hypothetical protein